MIKVWHVGNFPNEKEVKRHGKTKGIINCANCTTAPNMPERVFKIYIYNYQNNNALYKKTRRDQEHNWQSVAVQETSFKRL